MDCKALRAEFLPYDFVVERNRLCISSLQAKMTATDAQNDEVYKRPGFVDCFCKKKFKIGTFSTPELKQESTLHDDQLKYFVRVINK